MCEGNEIFSFSLSYLLNSKNNNGYQILQFCLTSKIFVNPKAYFLCISRCVHARERESLYKNMIIVIP